MIKRGLVLYIAIAAISVNCYGLTIRAGVASREVHSDTSTVYRNTTGVWDVVTQPFVEPYSGGRCVVLAFSLPSIPAGKMIADAKFSIYYVDRSPERVGPMDSLYAIPYSNESTITLADYYEGDFCGDMNNAAIESDLVNFDAAGTWHTTRAFGSQRLTRFLRMQYANGAQGGKWIFLRLNSELKGYNLYSRHSYASIYYNGGTQWAPSPFTPYIEYSLVDAVELAADETVEAAAVPELTPDIDPALYHTPIEQQPYYLYERERLGYNPRYAVNSPQFDSRNIPYMREKFAVCTLNDEGKWIRLNFKKFLVEAFPLWNGDLVGFAAGSDDRIVFDNDDDAYILLNLTGTGYILMHSKDFCRSWDIIPLFDSMTSARIEYRDGHNDLSNPPTIVTRTESSSGKASLLDLIAPRKDANSKVSLSKLIPINRGDGFFVSVLGGGLNDGKGAANLSVSLGSKVHVIYGGRYTVGTDIGTPQYIGSYDRITGVVTPSFYLGSAGTGEPDVHNWPGVILDSNGYVHAVLGAHGGKSGQCFKYRKSINPNNSTQFEDIINLPSGFTYLAVLCDKQNNLHVVARNHWDPYVQKLKHLKKPAGQSWNTVKSDLIVPYIDTSMPNNYNRYDHTLGIDRLGNLYVTYWHGARCYYGDTEAEKAFAIKWPYGQLGSDDEDDGTIGVLPPADKRSAGIIVSKDNGNTWKLLETKDFFEINGMKP